MKGEELVESTLGVDPLREWKAVRSEGPTDDERTVSASSDGLTWTPQYSYPEYLVPLDAQLAEATPDNAVLLRWAGKPMASPPPEWWDDTTDPFKTD